jgi:hypothetical protein
VAVEVVDSSQVELVAPVVVEMAQTKIHLLLVKMELLTPEAVAVVVEQSHQEPEVLE